MKTPLLPTRRFAPRKTGDASPLGELESVVMHIIWSSPEEIAVGDVHNALPDANRIAYTTIKTTMERLADKGILTRVREGKAYRYRASVSQPELERRIVTATLDRLVEQFPGAVASFFVHPDLAVSDDTLLLLEAAIERRRENQDA